MIDRNRTDKTAVTAVVSVITHAEYVAFRNFNFFPTAVFHRTVDIGFIQRFPIAPNLAVVESQRITGSADNSFDPNIFRL